MKRLAPLLVPLLRAAALPPRERVPDALERFRLERLGTGEGERERGRPAIGLGVALDVDSTDVTTHRFDQRLDHFSDETDGEHGTFRQRYFYTSRYVRRRGETGEESGAPVGKTLAFLCVGGEGPSLDASVLVDSVHCTGDMIGLAARLHSDDGYDVHLFALEHRFYGESFPTRPMPVGLRGGSTSDEDDGEEEFDVDFRYLSSRQAVKDVVNFVSSPEASERLGGPQGGPAGGIRWIAFGGSYPGMLSAWSHLLHPDAVFAAVSSSAPIEARLDFAAYHEHVGADLADPDVGGSETCWQVVEEGHAVAAILLDGAGQADPRDDGLDRLAEMFDVCDGGDALRASRANRQAFVGDGLIGIPAQSNDPSCKGELCNIEKLCKFIVDERKENPDRASIDILARVSKMQGKERECNDVDWKSYIDYYKQAMRGNANDRSWLYQTCSEFGFYQTCNKDSSCPYGRGYHPVEQDLEMCEEVFGIPPDAVKKNVDSTLSYYGGWKLTPHAEAEGGRTGPGVAVGGSARVEGRSRILFVSGTVDPWTELSLTKGNKEHPSISVKGASHHFWTHKVKDSDGSAVEDAREEIYETVTEWIGVSKRPVPIVGDEAVIADA